MQYLNQCLKLFTDGRIFTANLRLCYSALEKAISDGNDELIRKLLQENERDDHFMKDCITPCVMHALQFAQFKVVILLLQTCQGTIWQLPQHHMSDNIVRVNQESLHLLLSHCHDKELRQKVKRHLIYWAIKKRNVRGVHDVIRTDVDVNVPIPRLQNYLIHVAVVQAQEQIIACLAENSANVNAYDNRGETPLFIAIRMNNPSMVKLLINFGADVNHQNDEYSTPLHIAACSVHFGYEIMDLLLHNGAYFNITNRDGLTPLALGLRNCLTVVESRRIRCLVQHGCIPVQAKEIEELKEIFARCVQEELMLFLNEMGLFSMIYNQLLAEDSNEALCSIKSRFFSLLSAHMGEIAISKYNIFRPNEPMSLYGICHAKIRMYFANISRGQSIYNIIQGLSLPSSIRDDLILEPFGCRPRKEEEL